MDLQGGFVILTLYVDDCLVVGSNVEIIQQVEQALMKEYQMTDLGEASQCIGMEITRDKEGCIKISQPRYIKEKRLAKFGMSECKPLSTLSNINYKLSKDQCPKTKEEKIYMDQVPYQEDVDSLTWTMVHGRLDIAYAVEQVAQFMSNPGPMH